MGYLDQWKLRGREVTEEERANYTQGELCARRIAQLVNDLKMLTYALNIPRRLGGSATPPQLAQDKKGLRKSTHYCHQMILRWARFYSFDRDLIDLDNIPAELRKAGAQLDLLKWATERREQSMLDRSILASIGGTWPNQACAVISDELRELTRLIDFLM